MGKLKLNIKNTCIHCGSESTIRHGRNRIGQPRHKCKECNKTWVEGVSINTNVLDISNVSQEFLSGKTIRQLTLKTNSSPHRLNEKIRNFLSQASSWEEFLDNSSCVRDTVLVYLQGFSFSCSALPSQDNKTFVALAFEGLSSNIIGFELATKNDSNVWDRLITRLKKRGYKVNTFITKDLKKVEKTVSTKYPDAKLKIYLHKLRREKAVSQCALMQNSIMQEKVRKDALEYYNSLDNRALETFLMGQYKKTVKEVLESSGNKFFSCVNKNCGEHSEARLEQVIENFRIRFGKFHMLKTNPFPIVNAMIGYQMLQPLACGFTRYSLYNQIPCNCTFNCFACKHFETKCKVNMTKEQLHNFVHEVTLRALQLPIDIKKTSSYKFPLNLA